MSSSPGDRRQYQFESPENKDGAPLHQNSDSFLPLGFSTPQHRNTGQNANQRNYYSAQPKYMLPRQRGFQHRGRNQQHQQGGGGNSSAGSEDGPSSQPPERRNFNNRNWKGNNFHHQQQQQQQQHHQQRRNRFGFGHNQTKDNSKYNINDYFHPSMLEDPWVQLVAQMERSRQEEADSSDAGGGGSSGGGED